MKKGAVNARGSGDGIDIEIISANDSGVLKTTILIPNMYCFYINGFF